MKQSERASGENPDQLSPEEQRDRRTQKRFHHFMQVHIDNRVKLGTFSSAVYAEISRDGIQVELYGAEENREKLVSMGLVNGTDWSAASFGETAVLHGLRQLEGCCTIGLENQNPCLHEYAVYFYPARYRNVGDSQVNEVKLLGGLAAIVPLKEAVPLYMGILTAVVQGVIQRLSNTERSSLYLSMLDVARISFYLPNEHLKEPTIHAYTDMVFELAGTRERDLLLQPLTQIVDTLPENAELWEAIERQESFENREIKLSILGKQMTAVVSLLIYEQPQLDLKNAHLFFTTPQWLSFMLPRQNREMAKNAFSGVIGESPAIKSAIQRGIMVSQVQGNIMLLGESGTGKEVFAHAIHDAGTRSKAPFVAVNCGALPRDLIDSELFGYEPGTFTGASRQGKAGKFEQANGGTLFLDELGELPLSQQVRLLRAVETKKITRLGGSREIAVDVQIICATNADLQQLMKKRLFREDLYYRLSTFQVYLPPLRDRGGDVVLLAEHFIRTFSVRLQRKSIPTLTGEAKQLLISLPWHGNVRELKNLIECLVSLYSGTIISSEMISENIRMEERALVAREDAIAIHKERIPVKEEQLRAVLQRCGGNRTAAAAALGISRRTLYNYLERYRMSED